MTRRIVAILGGVSRFMQVQRMRAGADIVVGTPGRICDLMATGELKLNEVSHFVLDEADRMLDLGFIRDIRRIVAALPAERQSSLFSATMPAEVGKLAETLLRNPVRVDVARSAPVELPIEQHVHFVEPAGKRALLDRLLADPALSRVIVFTRTKRSANRVAETLDPGGVRVSALHGNKSQPARLKALEQFRSGRARVLVATDIAARGIDVTGISHVINFDLPAQPEDYVHRIGRTARAGASGVAISFCDSAEHATLRAIERMTGTAIHVAGGSPAAVQPARGQAPPTARITRRPASADASARADFGRRHDTELPTRISAHEPGPHEHSDDIAYPSSIGFVLIHVGCFAVFWTGLTWRALVLAVVLYLVRIFAIGAGYHRYFAHRAFRTSRVFQFCLAFLAQTSAQRGVLWWAAKHRLHHRYSDTDLDVHSPVRRAFSTRMSAGSSCRGMMRRTMRWCATSHGTRSWCGSTGSPICPRRCSRL